MRILNGQVLFAFVLVALNTIYLSQLIKMDTPFSAGEPGPAFLPWILCVFVYLAIAYLVFSELRDPKRKQNIISEHIPYIQVTGPLFAVGLTMVFIAGFFYAGYVVSALIYTFLVTLFFNFEQTGLIKHSIMIAGLTAICVTLFGWLFFVKLFDLYLPVWGG